VLSLAALEKWQAADRFPPMNDKRPPTMGSDPVPIADGR
jgi:hypothetical protein